MGNILLNSIENFKEKNEISLWGIHSLIQYYDINRQNLIIIKKLNNAEKLYRSSVTSGYLKKKFKKLKLTTLENLLQCIENYQDTIIENEIKLYKISKKYLIRFIGLLNIILFQRNQKNNQEITELSLLLRKNGLSSSGIHVLKSLGLASSTKTFSKKLSIFSKDNNKSITSCNYLHVHWYDNLYRSLKGFISLGDTSVCYTAHGITKIIDTEPIPISNNILSIPNINNLFNNNFKNHVSSLSNNPLNQNNTLLSNYTELTIPLRTPINNPLKERIQFSAESILNSSPASPSGTLKILDHLLLSHYGLNSSYYCFLTVDYDIYWRLNRMFHSDSFMHPSFPKCKQKLIITLGPWHILYNLLNKLWHFFLPYLFTFLYFDTIYTTVHSKTNFSTQLHFIIALHKYKNTLLPLLNLPQNQNQNGYNIIYILRWLLDIFIPTFLEFALSIYHSDGERYINLLPYIATFFTLFHSNDKSNYFKATVYQYSHFHYLTTINHPALSVIHDYFSAFNEEKGEKSIREAFIHLRDSDFSFDNLNHHYRLLPAYKQVQNKFDFSPTIKSASDGYKTCNLDPTLLITPTDERNEKISLAFIQLIDKINLGTYRPYLKQKTSFYTPTSTMVENYSDLTDDRLLTFTQKLALNLTPFENALTPLAKLMREDMKIVFTEPVDLGEY